MTYLDQPARRWSDVPPSRRISVLLLAAALVFLALPTFGTAQAPRRAATPIQAATRALIQAR
jgi:hypothetical protein